MRTEARYSRQHCSGHIAFPSKAAGQITYFCLMLFFVFAVAGCKPKEKEQVIANNVVESEQALIRGQIFIVTKGRENVVLGDVKVALLDSDETGTYFNSKALEWSNALAVAQAKVEKATINYDALYKDDLAKFTAAKKYHESIMATVPAGSPEWNQAFEWSKKVAEEIRGLHKLKESSDARKQLNDAVREQANLWDEINWPSADHFWPRIEITTTDSEGRFKFIVPKSSANSNLMLFAKAERQVTDEKEKYWWMVNANWDGRKTTEFILSNDNMNLSGVWPWFGDRLVLNAKDFSPMQNCMMHYEAEMETAKSHRDFQEWQEDLEDGK